MKNLLYVSFDIDASKEYPCVLDEPYTDNFNEQIDSMSILIDNITEQIQFTRPYHFVKIVNKGEDGFKWASKNADGTITYKNSVIMLLDNYVETETDIFNHIYKYQLNLMNVVKLLEKIQCPNLVITHSLVNGSHSIWWYINHYMKLYSPKIKISTDGETWSYDYLFKWNNLNTALFNGTVAADMQMNSPTLREVITNLMLQVGCIPAIEYRTLKYINFREDQDTFDYSHGITMTTKSGASDSYANVLISQPTQVLDTTNEVITEKIGFRDDKNCLIKQTENLKLQTRFPIYNIKKVMLQYDIPKYYFWPSNIYNNYAYENGIYPIIAGNDTVNPQYLFRNPCIIYGFGTYSLLINYTNVGHKMKKGTFRNLKAHICEYDSVNDKYTEVSVVSTEDKSWLINYDDTSSNNNVTNTNTKKAYELKSDGTFGPDTPSHIVSSFTTEFTYYIYLTLPSDFILDTDNGYIWYECEFVLQEDGKVIKQFVPLRKILSASNQQYPELKATTLMKYELGSSNDNITYSNFYANVHMEQNASFKGGWQTDLTPCFVEQGKRALLNTNFKEMTEDNSIDTLEELSQYIYGTVSYAIGGTEITGFSEMYSQVQGWWKLTSTYFDNILKFIKDHELSEKVAPTDAEAQAYSIKYGNMPVTTETLFFTNEEPAIDSNKSKYLFDITYQPLNSFKFKLSKKQDINIPLEVQQLNQSADGLSEYSRLIKNNQDIINRVGNEILFIPQTVSDVSHLNKLNSLYNDKYTVFQRKIQLHEDYIECLYSASEKFVMQNYFTSIIQKYRSYQYVDYNQSVVRKENDTIYCLLSSKTYFNGDDKINWSTVNSEILLSGILPSDNSYQINYNIKTGIESTLTDYQSIKNEVSVLTHDTGFAVVYQDFDNVSAGPYILEEVVSSNFWAFDPDSLPGLVQKWQMWDQESFNESHKVSYANKIQISDLDLEDIIKLPILVDNITPLLFTVQTNTTNHQYEFYKDNAEVINQTVQFEYYCDSDELEFTKNFIKKCRLVNQLSSDIQVNKMYLANKNDELYEKTSSVSGRTEVTFDSSLFSVGTDSNGIAYIEIKWTSISEATANKKLILSCNLDGNIYDFIAFRYKNSDTKYYLTLNDTKSSEVWYFTSDSDLFTIKECANGINRYLKSD